MRKSTINLILGILIGLIISQVSDFNYTNSLEDGSVEMHLATTTPIVEPITPHPFESQVMAPGLQIVEVPPPLDINGRVPYQCYFNGEVVQLPKELVKKFLDDNGIENDSDVNVHNFLGNLEYVDLPVGTQLPSRKSSAEVRTR
jgi:hypothetical protein